MNSDLIKTSSRARPNELANRQVELLSIAQGFLPASALFALVRLGIFERISDSTRSVDDLAAETGAQPEHLARLLNAGVMLGLLETEDRIDYRVPADYQPLLVASDEPGYLGNWLQFMESWYAPFATLDQAVLRGGRTNMYNHDQSIIRQNTLAMHNFASVRGKEFAAVLDTSGCRAMLDVGCGPGTYSFQLGMRNPEMTLNLLDLPAVLEVTRSVQEQYDLTNEIRYVPHDLSTDKIPGTYDLVLVSNALQAFDEDKIRSLLREFYGAINRGGSLIVQAQFLADDHLGPRWPIFVDLGCLCFTPGGRNHSIAETLGWLEETGFTDIEQNRMSLFNANSFLRAYKH
ncbi:MAG: methyltransferase [Gemmatimonadaceae bacterium]